MSARDLARFGQLFLQNGKWEGNQIISENWVKESTAAYSKTPDAYNGEYGYLWWRSTIQRFKDLDTYLATGLHENNVMIIPKENMVIVHLHNSYLPFSPFMSKLYRPDYYKLMEKILDAKVSSPKYNSKLVPMKEEGL